MMNYRNWNGDSYKQSTHIHEKIAPQLWKFESSLYFSKLVNYIDLVGIDKSQLYKHFDSF